LTATLNFSTHVCIIKMDCSPPLFLGPQPI
jgi:hypothetical protein